MIGSEPPARPPAVCGAPLSRRGLFQLGGFTAALAATPAIARTFGSGFTHGVASGEPGQNRVLLWTRYVGSQDTPLNWQIINGERSPRFRSTKVLRIEPAPRTRALPREPVPPAPPLHCVDNRMSERNLNPIPLEGERPREPPRHALSP